MALRKKLKKVSASKKIGTKRKLVRKMTLARRRHCFNFWCVTVFETLPQ